MKTINLFFSSSWRNFKSECKKRKIRAKTIKRGSGRNHCTGSYKYRWIETDSPNYDIYISHLNQWGFIDVFFYSEDDRTKFIEELTEKIQFDVVETFHPNSYYGMESVYGIEIKKP